MPAGAQTGGNNESWDWIGSNPAPYSGATAHQSAPVSGLHNHYFMFATQTLAVSAGEKLFAYVYIDPSNLPTELMLQWHDGSTWYNAYWGADNIGVANRTYIGPLPATGQWVRLEVAASVLGLEGKTLSGMSFTMYGGRATWDKAGKSTGQTPPPETVWVEDSVPAGAQTGGNNESWNWIGSNPAPYSGATAHQSAPVSGLHNHYFMFATQAFLKLRPNHFLGAAFSSPLKFLSLTKPGRYALIAVYNSPFSRADVGLKPFFGKESGPLKSNIVWIEVF